MEATSAEPQIQVVDYPLSDMEISMEDQSRTDTEGLATIASLDCGIGETPARDRFNLPLAWAVSIEEIVLHN